MLGRAHMVKGLARSLADTTEGQARLLFVCTRGDRAVLDAVRDHDYMVLPRRAKGDYAAKINAGIAASDEPLIFTGAIDLRFRHGWLNAARRMMVGRVGVVGTDDLNDPRTGMGLHSTHMLVARWYADLGQIDGAPGFMHEGYWHEYVDNEAVAVAKFRDAYAHAYGAQVEHLHWSNGKRKADSVDDMHQIRMAVGKRLFVERRHLWT